MRFLQLANVLQQLEEINSGNKIRAILSSFLKTVPKKEIDNICYFILGSIASKFDELNIGMADKLVLRAIASASNKDNERVKKLFKQKGDIGSTAESLIKEKDNIYVKDVFSTLHKIAGTTGKGSQEQKVSLLANILKRSSSKSAKYISRIVIGNLRIGVSEMTILDSLAIAFTGKKENKKILEHAYNICPDVGIIARTLVSKRLNAVNNIDLALGRPIQMMLAQRVSNITMISEKITGLIAAEEKYDGERIQVHKKGNNVVLFSRRLENITSQFPDIVEAIKKQVSAKETIIEGEVVPIDEKGNLLPFQILMQRRRKYEIEKYVKKVKVCFYLFDLLFLNGKSFLKRSYPERHYALEKIVKKSDKIKLANRSVCDNIDCVKVFFNNALKRGCEGIIAKSCGNDAVYQAGKRGWLWIKWKKEYAKEIADTFDLVVVGAFYGRGRRSGSYGALLCAAYNKKTDNFETICKLGSGLKDKDLEEMPKKFKKLVIKPKPNRVIASKDMKPDVWFEPKIVVEVLGAEITKSPIHKAAFEKGQGLAIRFPRFIRYREDKSPEQATTSKEILQMVKR